VRVAFEYAIVRVVPDVAREEFVNVGAILHARVADFLGCAFELDVPRLRAVGPRVDVALVEEQLASISRICAADPATGRVGGMPIGERFAWLAAPRSTIIQTSAVHGGVSRDLAATLAHLVATMVRPPAP
jgi:hypothetical protein